MTLSKKELREWLDSMRYSVTNEQFDELFEKFGKEPEPYVWTEQDISEQIRKFVLQRS